MPNWCFNKLIIKGKHDKLKKFVRLLSDDNHINKPFKIDPSIIRDLDLLYENTNESDMTNYMSDFKYAYEHIELFQFIYARINNRIVAPNSRKIDEDYIEDGIKHVQRSNEICKKFIDVFTKEQIKRIKYIKTIPNCLIDYALADCKIDAIDYESKRYSKKALENIIEQINSNTPIYRFQNILPENPLSLYRPSYYRYQLQPENVFFSDWYISRNNLIGTKWYPSEIFVKFTKPNELILEFDSAWNPTDVLVEFIAYVFDLECKIIYSCYEEEAQGSISYNYDEKIEEENIQFDNRIEFIYNDMALFNRIDYDALLTDIIDYIEDELELSIDITKSDKATVKTTLIENFPFLNKSDIRQLLGLLGFKTKLKIGKKK